MVSLVVQLARPTPAPVAGDVGAAPFLGPQPRPAPIPDYPRILERTLFSPSRGAEGAAGMAGAASTALGDYTLVGVASVGGRGEAVWRGAAGEVISLHPGDVLMGWRLAEVGHGGVVLEQAGLRRTVPAGASAAPKTTGQ